MFEKILIATDFSPASDCLVECAAELTSFGVKKAVLAHVVYIANSRGLEDMFEAQAPALLEPQKRRLEEHGIEVETALEFGIPARDLNALAERHNVGAILIGSRGSNLLKSTLGSVSFRLLQIARRPVFLSRINVLRQNESCNVSVCGQMFSNVLFATDFSDAAERAFGYVEDIAREFKAGITLLHVFGRNYAELPLTESGINKQKEFDLRRVEEKKQRLEEMKMRLETLGSAVQIDWTTGVAAAKEILARSGQGPFSLVVMGNHGKGFFREALLGSVANEVIRHSELPVLLIPSRVADGDDDFERHDRLPPNWPKDGISQP
jgi:nucleotide-binding universal stress UspA family protein